jgi:hypothetical protein
MSSIGGGPNSGNAQVGAGSRWHQSSPEALALVVYVGVGFGVGLGVGVGTVGEWP